MTEHAGTWFWSQTPPPPASPDSVATLHYFRRELTLSGSIESQFAISADTRYRLWVNDVLVAAGPAKPRPGEWFLDRVSLDELLVSGANVLAVEVLRYRPTKAGNVSVMRTSFPGLYVEGHVRSDAGDVDLSDPAGWRGHDADNHRVTQGVYTVFLGIQEQAAGRSSLNGWKRHGYDEGSWTTCAAVDTGQDETKLEPWPLDERPTPPLTLEPRRLVATQGRAIPGSEPFDVGASTLIPARTSVVVDLDAGELMTAYLNLRLVDGAGAHVSLLCAEGYELPPRDIPWLRTKGDRTDYVNGDLYGDADDYSVCGEGTEQSPEQFSPFWFRTFRYVRLSITTANEPMTISGIDVLQTRYPLDLTGGFASSEPRHAKLWEVSVRTLRSCMHDTYEDCPYYEQLQYAMDTRAQALYTLAVSSDDRLIRRAITDFRSSMTPTGLLASRFPSVVPQVIPGFSLFWILMVYEHYIYCADAQFLRLQLGTVDSVLDAMLRKLGPQGLVEPTPDLATWDFLDWTDEWRDSKGVPDAGESNTFVVYSLILASALRRGAELHNVLGRTDRALELSADAERICESVRHHAWDDTLDLVADSAGGQAVSQHAQVWAVLAGCVTGDAATALLSRMLDTSGLAVCSYASSLDLFDALAQAGLAKRINLSPWYEMLDQNLTTWAEDTVSQRSDCHAWGAVPLHHLHRNVLGVRSTSVGWSAVDIRPDISGLDWASGTVPTPLGLLTVRCERRVDGGLRINAMVPEGMTATFDEQAEVTLTVGRPDERHNRS